jgi:hemerythrin
MSHIVWDEKYSVNIEVIDEQHKKIIEVLGQLFDEMGKKKSREVLKAILDQMIWYAGEHFGTEEIFMKQYNFPGYEEHKKEHEAFKEKVVVFQKDFASGKEALSVNMLRFLTEWLDHHILDIDKQYGPFLNEKGIF